VRDAWRFGEEEDAVRLKTVLADGSWLVFAFERKDGADLTNIKAELAGRLLESDAVNAYGEPVLQNLDSEGSITRERILWDASD